MTTIVESDATLARRFTDAAGPAEVLGSMEQVKVHLSNRPQEFVLILGPSIQLSAATALADTLRVTRPTIGVILVRSEVDTGVLAEALRSGMREVVPLDDLSGLGLAVKRSRGLHDALLTAIPSQAPPEPEGKVVSVFSAKGGVGKTTMATNLAVALADDGANEVCLVDLDLSFGDVAIALQIFPTRTIADTVAMQAHLDLEGLESLLTAYRNGVFALAAPVNPHDRDTITPRLVGDILKLLRSRFAYVVIDTPPAFDDHVLQAFDESDLIVLVATPDIPALKNLKIACETISLLNIPREQLRVVLNRADSRVGISPEEVAASLGMSISTAVPSSRDVPAAVNRGELLFLSDPRNPVSQAVKRLATDIINVTEPADAPARGSAAANGVAKPQAGHSGKRKPGLFTRKPARA